jgi:hypothetical protein
VPIGLPPYQLALREHPGYLHARVTGAHTPENVLRFLKESYTACVERGISALLLEMNLEGPSLDTASVFGVIRERSADATKLRKIGYVDASPRDVERMKFAETVAVNRGANVRLFRDLQSAHEWMSAP